MIEERFLYNTYNIILPSSTCSGFMIRYNEKNILVTAKHSFVKENNDFHFNLKNSNCPGNFFPVNGKLIFHPNPDVDIAVIELKDFPYNDGLVFVDGANVAFGQDCYFLGFPYSMSTLDYKSQNRGFPVAFVKKASFSAVSKNNDAISFYLDGHNNPGFSGGMVICKNIVSPHDWVIYGVVSGYIPQNNQHLINGLYVNYMENSGIMLCSSCIHIREILNSI